MSFSIDEGTLQQAFTECGEIEETRFTDDKESGEFKGYGHIQFINTESTDLAVKMVGQKLLVDLLKLTLLLINGIKDEVDAVVTEDLGRGRVGGGGFSGEDVAFFEK